MLVALCVVGVEGRIEEVAEVVDDRAGNTKFSQSAGAVATERLGESTLLDEL